MKKPYFTKQERDNTPEWALQRDISILKLKKIYETTKTFKLIKKFVEWLSVKLNKYFKKK